MSEMMVLWVRHKSRKLPFCFDVVLEVHLPHLHDDAAGKYALTAAQTFVASLFQSPASCSDALKVTNKTF
jgi:hypothetical protein